MACMSLGMKFSVRQNPCYYRIPMALQGDIHATFPNNGHNVNISIESYRPMSVSYISAENFAANFAINFAGGRGGARWADLYTDALLD